MPTPPGNAADKRRAPRHPVLNQARILAEPSALYCAIRDLSATGARLQVGRDTWLPPHFNVMLSRENLVVGAKITWRTREYVGIAFDRPLERGELDAAMTRAPLAPRERR
jgi:hypothetical protein